MISENDKIEPGTLKLQSSSRPPLVAGEYQVKTGVTVKGVAAGNTDAVYNNNGLTFVVNAPRLSLGTAITITPYPPAGLTGAYHTTLPHVVLSSKTILWERVIDDIANKNPWMALLLLTTDELTANNVVVKDITTNQLTDNGGDATLLVPAIALESWENTGGKVKVIEMPLGLFNSIAPKKEDHPLLAHARQVDMLAKQDGAANTNGWHSALVCNRLPQAGKDNTVFMVSLEGHTDSRRAGTPTNRIRLVVLYQWSFTEAGATFDELATNLLKNISPLRIQTPAANNSQPAVQKAINFGYMPLSHEIRNGQKTVSWYRGPLVPVDVSAPNLYQYNSADQALRFDPQTGMFDISYAAAWQLGRMLALKSPGFFKTLDSWKNSFDKQKAMNAAAAILGDGGQGLGIKPDELSELAHNASSDEVLTDFLIELWNKP